MVDTTPQAARPLVSVVIPAYDAERYIARTLASAVAQSHAALDIIVVDDGSRDETARIVRTAAAHDPRIRLIQTDNRGVAAARNTGLETASGAFVAFLDADDLWHPTKIERQVDALSRLPAEWAAVYCLHHVIDENDVLLGAGSTRLARGRILAQHLTYRFVGNGSALLVRRQAAIDIGGFDSSYAAAGIGGCEDFDFEVRLAERFLMEVVPERLVGYRHHPENMSSNYQRMAESMVSVVGKSLARRPDLHPKVAASARAAAHKYALNQYRHARKPGRILKAALAILLASPGYVLHLIAARLSRGRITGSTVNSLYSGHHRFGAATTTAPGPDTTGRAARRRLAMLKAIDDREPSRPGGSSSLVAE